MRHVSPGTEIHTFTAGYGNDDWEIVRAREAAVHFATLHHEIVVGPDALPAVFPEVVRHMEEAAGAEEMTYQFMTAREAARHVSIVFTGHLADMLFAGMPRHKLLKLAISLPPLRGGLEEFFHYTQQRNEPQSLMGKLLVRGYFRDDAGAAVAVIGSLGLPPPHPLNFNAREPLSEQLRTDFLDPSSKLAATFQFHAAHGLEWNSPFMDADVTRTAFQIPDSLKIHGLRQKHILRLASRGLVPEFILERKKGLQRLRADTRLAATLEQLADRYLASPDVKSRGIFRPADIERTRRRPVSGVYTREQVTTLWQLILTEIWARLFIDGRGGPPAHSARASAG